MTSAQQFSHYPSWPLPIVEQTLGESSPDACNYLAGREATFRAFGVEALTPAEYQAYMDAGFRRSGRVVYQPICRGCRACVPLRVAVDSLEMTKSLRRTLRRNDDLQIKISAQEPTAEKWMLYQNYQKQWHGKNEEGAQAIAGFLRFLYDSPVESVDFEYRNPGGKLIAVGICDVAPTSLSSVYFYFDPDEAKRSLGTFSALYEMLWAKQMSIPYWYAGYWINGCATMQYKSRFHPHELLGTDGVWRAGEERPHGPVLPQGA